MPNQPRRTPNGKAIFADRFITKKHLTKNQVEAFVRDKLSNSKSIASLVPPSKRVGSKPKPKKRVDYNKIAVEKLKSTKGGNHPADLSIISFFKKSKTQFKNLNLFLFDLIDAHPEISRSVAEQRARVLINDGMLPDFRGVQYKRK